MSVPLILRSEKTDQMIPDWRGKNIWFSPNLPVQRLSAKYMRQMIIQFGAEFQAINLNSKTLAVLARDENIAEIKAPRLCVRNIISNWKGEDIWFSPSLRVQRFSFEGIKFIIQVGSGFQVVRQGPNDLAILAQGEDAVDVQAPLKLLPLFERWISAKKKALT